MPDKKDYTLYDSAYSKISRKYTLICNDKKQFWCLVMVLGTEKKDHRGNWRIKDTPTGSGGVTGIHGGPSILIPN